MLHNVDGFLRTPGEVIEMAAVSMGLHPMADADEVVLALQSKIEELKLKLASGNSGKSDTQESTVTRP
jgi:hypothetical protein